MPLSRYLTISAPGVTPGLNLDPSIAPFSVAIQVYVGVGVTTTYSVEYTLDEVDNPNARWTEDPQFPAGSSATLVGNYAFPICGVRVNAATLTGGNLELKILQGMSIN